MKVRSEAIFAIAILIIACGPDSTSSETALVCDAGYGGDPCVRLAPALVIQHVELLDGTGALPKSDHSVVVIDGQITEVGPSESISVFADDTVIEGTGLHAIPGVINAHVHQSYSESNLRAWAQSGVTTVRDVGMALAPPDTWPVDYWDQWADELLSGEASLDDRRPPPFEWRDTQKQDPTTARVLMAGPCLTAPESYPPGNSLALHVAIEAFMEDGVMITPEQDAARKTQLLADAGADHIKICLENNWGQRTDWDVLGQSQIEAITRAAADAGLVAVAHTSAFEQLEKCVNADPPIADAVHMPTDGVSVELMEQMIGLGVMIVPTLEVWHEQPAICEEFGYCEDARNLDQFVDLGGQVAVGDDYGNFGIALGMPTNELELMGLAGLTNLELVTAATMNGALAIARSDVLGSIERGKIADIVLLGSDPLIDIVHMADVEYVIKDGVIIREP